MRHPAQDILRIPDVCIAQSSDVVLTKKGVVWDKYYNNMYPYMIPLDSDVSAYNNETILHRKSAKIVHVDGDCISMLGVFAEIWSHFIMQFLHKFYYAEKAGLLNKGVTVIIPDYKDAHVRQLVYDVLDRHPSCIVITVPHLNYRIQYNCESLYWIPTTSAISNDYHWPSVYHNIIPRQVMDILHKNVFGKYKGVVSDWCGEKIYLVRRAKMRNITNNDEVERFFCERGFVFVEPHKLSLEQKIGVFQNAKIIAGAHSSAWTNAMFCKHAKGLMLTPINWLSDTYIGYNTLSSECKITMLPGKEVAFVNSQNDFEISLQSLQEAYDALLNE